MVEYGVKNCPELRYVIYGRALALLDQRFSTQTAPRPVFFIIFVPRPAIQKVVPFEGKSYPTF